VRAAPKPSTCLTALGRGRDEWTWRTAGHLALPGGRLDGLEALPAGGAPGSASEPGPAGSMVSALQRAGCGRGSGEGGKLQECAAIGLAHNSPLHMQTAQCRGRRQRFVFDPTQNILLDNCIRELISCCGSSAEQGLLAADWRQSVVLRLPRAPRMLLLRCRRRSGDETDLQCTAGHRRCSNGRAGQPGRSLSRGHGRLTTRSRRGVAWETDCRNRFRNCSTADKRWQQRLHFQEAIYVASTSRVPDRRR
jgi:hypothetical protein